MQGRLRATRINPAILRRLKQIEDNRAKLLKAGWQIKQDDDDPAAPLPWVVENLLLEKAPAIISALPHSMKSLIWLFACMEAPATHKVFGHFDASGVRRTLFIESEDPESLIQSRIQGFIKGLQVRHIPGFYYVRTGPFDLVKTNDTLKLALEEYKPDFAVLSTMQNLVGNRNIKEQADMADFNAVIVELATRYCPIVLIHHSPQDERVKRGAGSVTIAANFPMAMHVEKETQTLVKVTPDTKLDAMPAFYLQLETENVDGTSEVRRVKYLANKPLSLRNASDAIRQELGANPKASTADLAEKYNVSDRQVQKVKRALKAAKRTQKANSGSS